LHKIPASMLKQWPCKQSLHTILQTLIPEAAT
jgi:hypothetical protein